LSKPSETTSKWKNNNDLMSSKNLHNNVKIYLQIFQTAALLEIFHSSIGLVRSNPLLAFLQALSRIMVTWFVFNVSETVKI
jgi:hypothetical protein